MQVIIVRLIMYLKLTIIKKGVVKVFNFYKIYNF